MAGGENASIVPPRGNRAQHVAHSIVPVRHGELTFLPPASTMAGKYRWQSPQAECEGEFESLLWITIMKTAKTLSVACFIVLAVYAGNLVGAELTETVRQELHRKGATVHRPRKAVPPRRAAHRAIEPQDPRPCRDVPERPGAGDSHAASGRRRRPAQSVAGFRQRGVQATGRVAATGDGRPGAGLLLRLWRNGPLEHSPGDHLAPSSGRTCEASIRPSPPSCPTWKTGRRAS